MNKDSWRLLDLWTKHSRPLGGMRMMNFLDFVAAMEDLFKSIGRPMDENEGERDARKAAEE